VPAHIVQKLSQALLDLLLPPHCVNCKATNSWLCQNCLNRIAFITTEICERCGAPAASPQPEFCVYCQGFPLHYIDGIRAASIFEDNPIRSVIHDLKYHNHQAISTVLATMLADAYRRYALAVDVLIPVPLHPSRLKERGYNQSELLARRLGNLLHLPVSTTILHRTKKTASQVTLGVDERRKNVADAFCSAQTILHQKILLVDDVCTTGSTLDACAMALKAGGAASVWGLTVARAC
jgi:ComF family protein